MLNAIAGQIPIVASISAAGTKFRSKPTPSRNHQVTTWAAYTVSWRLRRNCPASRENGRASISRWSGVGSPSFKMGRPSSITKKSQESRAAPWTATKNCRDPFIFREVKKGTYPIAASLSRQRRGNTDQHATPRPMTHFLNDILRQPNTLKRTIDFLLGAGRPALDAATAAIRGARHVYLTGIGSSWHAVLTAGPLCHLRAHPV